ncbi:MAG: hypothetical protein KGL69_12390 [Alphaproteobacteria bacterium]|jgi:hypothetical protein|nr:hypothetical protein [Alphaproteobacteria bacterium]
MAIWRGVLRRLGTGLGLAVVIAGPALAASPRAPEDLALDPSAAGAAAAQVQAARTAGLSAAFSAAVAWRAAGFLTPALRRPIADAQIPVAAQASATLAADPLHKAKDLRGADPALRHLMDHYDGGAPLALAARATSGHPHRG